MKKKQKLSELKVLSFVTSIEDNDLEQVKGGSFAQLGCGGSQNGCTTAYACSTSDRYGSICYSTGC